MFMMMIMLAVSSTIVEMMFAANFAAWRVNAHKYKWFNMVVSVLISFILGVAFSAGGLIALGAAMISTVLSIPGYAFLHWNFDSPRAHARGGNQFAHIKQTSKEAYEKWSVALSDLAKLFYSLIRLITFPIWFTRNIYIKAKPYIVKFNDWSEARRASRTTTI